MQRGKEGEWCKEEEKPGNSDGGVKAQPGERQQGLAVLPAKAGWQRPVAVANRILGQIVEGLTEDGLTGDGAGYCKAVSVLSMVESKLQKKEEKMEQPGWFITNPE